MPPKDSAETTNKWCDVKVWISFEHAALGKEPYPNKLRTNKDMGKMIVALLDELQNHPDVNVRDPKNTTYVPTIGTLTNPSIQPYTQIQLRYNVVDREVLKSPHSTKPILHNGVIVDVPPGKKNFLIPKTQTIAVVGAIKTIIDAAITTVVSSDITSHLDKIEMFGIKFGEQGIHFPS